MKRPYRQMVADYNRRYRHQVRLINTGDWCNDYCSRQHYAVTGGAFVLWYDQGVTVFGFDTADQAAVFQHWADTCGIDWAVPPGNQALLPRPPLPPIRPVTVAGYYGHSERAIDRDARFTPSKPSSDRRS